MKTIDSILPSICQEIKSTTMDIPSRDKRILVSLHKQLSSGLFLTENQGNLLKKILKENLNSLVQVTPDLETVLDQNLWSLSFRKLKKIRKITVSPAWPSSFIVEFNFNSRFREKINKLSSKIKGMSALSPTKYAFTLTEDILYTVISEFIGENFEIDEKLMTFFTEIKKIRESSTNPYNIFSSADEKFKKHIVDTVGNISKDNLLMLHDRKIRYQYTIDEKIEENTLFAKIASRKNRKVFINSTTVSLNDVLEALRHLKRLPALLVFDGHKADFDKKCLKLVEEAVKSNNLGSEIGIYFRYDKTTDSCNFNQEVSLIGYNKNLSGNTTLVGISNNKLPKFMVKMGWKPETVISFTNNFKSNKTAVYCTDVDLVVYYTNSQPFNEPIDVLV